jgi:hypothetical protein
MKRTDFKELKKEVSDLFNLSTCKGDAKLAFLLVAEAEGYTRREIAYTFCKPFDYDQAICDAVQKFDTDDVFAEKTRELL